MEAHTRSAHVAYTISKVPARGAQPPTPRGVVIVFNAVSSFCAYVQIPHSTAVLHATILAKNLYFTGQRKFSRYRVRVALRRDATQRCRAFVDVIRAAFPCSILYARQEARIKASLKARLGRYIRAGKFGQAGHGGIGGAVTIQPLQDTGFAEIVTAEVYAVVVVKIACAGLAEVGRSVNGFLAYRAGFNLRGRCRRFVGLKFARGCP